MNKSELSKKEFALIALVLFLLIILIIIDLITEYKSGSNSIHLLAEAVLAFLATISFLIIFNAFLKANQALTFSKKTLLEKEADINKWREESQKYQLGLSEAIDSQLERWNLSPSEKDIALLLLKGLSQKEIAKIRGTTDQTVRTQSAVVYQKSGLTERTELAAFFLEDLLTPINSKSNNLMD